MNKPHLPLLRQSTKTTMNISILLLWMASIAFLTDFIIYIFSYKYRKFGGHTIGTMAYLILLSDLTYSVYLGDIESNEFRVILTGTLLIGALFIIEHTINTYKHIILHDKAASAGHRESELEEEIIQLQNDLNKTKALYDKALDDNYTLISEIHEKSVQEENLIIEKGYRIKSNFEYENKLPQYVTTKQTRKGFQIYTLLIHGYEAERGPLFERHLNIISERMCLLLSEEEIDSLLQIDRKRAEEAGKLYDML